VKVNASGEVDLRNVDADQLSFGIGVDGGVYFGRFLLGAEIGYKSLKLEKSGLFQVIPSLDMSGYYGRLQVGVGLF